MKKEATNKWVYRVVKTMQHKTAMRKKPIS